MGRRARGILLGGGALAAVAAALLAAFGLPASAPPPTSPTSTPPASTSTAPNPTVSTTAPAPPSSSLPGEAESFDVVVVGDSLGGVSAAITAARRGASVLLLSPVGYFGGQASAGGVSTFDEGAGRDLLRRGGLYRELIDYLDGLYGTPTPGGCYFAEDTICPEPDVVDRFFRTELASSGVEVRPLGEVERVVQSGAVVTGLVADGVEYAAEVVVDATELQELYPMVEGIWFTLGSTESCIQDITWVAVRSWYPGGAPPELVPPADALETLRARYGNDEVESWLTRFRSMVAPDPDAGQVTLTTWPTSPMPWTPNVELGYRAMADRRPEAKAPGAPPVTRTAANLTNDAPIQSFAFGDPARMEESLRRALHITYAYLWYLRWELGISDWGVSNDLGYDRATRWLWDPLVPDALEANLPPQPYVREARQLRTIAALRGENVSTQARLRTRFPDSVMLGHYYTDSHGCPLPEPPSGDGLYEVPLGVFIPEDVDGFLPGMARASGLDRTAASSLRTQPDEIWSGQIVGFLAATAAAGDVPPRSIQAGEVQVYLASIGWSPRVP